MQCFGEHRLPAVVVGSLPTTSNAVLKSRAMNVRWAFRQAAEKDRLTACAAQTQAERSALKTMKHKPFRGLSAILFKEFIVVWRDPLTLFFFFFPPLIEMIAFGYALDNDVKHMAMLVLNEDRTVESRQLIDRFVNTESFRVVGEVQNLEQLKSEMRKGRAYAALDIPPNFTRELMAGPLRAGAIAGRRIQFHHGITGSSDRTGRGADAINGIAFA